jgi:hypothetical protein
MYNHPTSCNGAIGALLLCTGWHTAGHTNETMIRSSNLLNPSPQRSPTLCTQRRPVLGLQSVLKEIQDSASPQRG